MHASSRAVIIAKLHNNMTAVNIGAVAISRSAAGSNTAGGSSILECSATITPVPDPIVSSSTFEWFFGPNNGSLPSGVTATENISSNGDTYTSTLWFSPLSHSHTGMYTCRLGGNARLADTFSVIVNGMTVL